MTKRKYIEELSREIESLRDQIEKLKKENAELQRGKDDIFAQLGRTEDLLRENLAINMTIKEKALPKCESDLCVGCVHCATQMVGGRKRIVGCRKDIDCTEYMPKPEVIPIPYPAREPPTYIPYYNPLSNVMSR